MNKALVISAALLSLLVASPVFAASFQAGQTYTLDKQTTLSDDLYAAAGSPIISGTILGDAMLAGGNITFNGSTRNLMAAGGTITVLGTVSGSVRAVGGTITINGPVGGDVVVAGGTVSVVNTTIGRDAAIAGGEVNLGASVARNVTLRGGNVVINGTVNGDVDVQASQSFSLGEHAVIKGDLVYSSPAEVTKAPGAVISGEVTYNPIKNPAKNYDAAGILAGFVGFLFVIKVLAVATAVIIATTLFNRSVAPIALSTLENLWKDIVIGFVALVVVPIACVVLFISVFGLVIGALTLFAYITTLIAAKVLAPIITGAYLSKWYKKEATVDWKWALLGLVVLDVVGIIPILGWVVTSVVCLAAFGTLASLLYYSIADAR